MRPRTQADARASQHQFDGADDDPKRAGEHREDRRCDDDHGDEREHALQQTARCFVRHALKKTRRLRAVPCENVPMCCLNEPKAMEARNFVDRGMVSARRRARRGAMGRPATPTIFGSALRLVAEWERIVASTAARRRRHCGAGHAHVIIWTIRLEEKGEGTQIGTAAYARSRSRTREGGGARAGRASRQVFVGYAQVAGAAAGAVVLRQRALLGSGDLAAGYARPGEGGVDGAASRERESWLGGRVTARGGA